MNLSRLPVRRVAVVALVALLALGANACSGFGPVGPSAAAEVNGTSISTDDVFELLEASTRTQAALSSGADSSSSSDAGTGLQDTWQMTSFSGLLQSMILRETIEHELDQRDIEVTDANRTEAREQLVSQLGSEDDLKKVDERLVDFSVDAGAAQLALTASLESTTDPEAREEQLRDAYEQAKGEQSEVCISVVVSETEVDAQAVKERLDGGEDVAALAQAESIDQQSAANGGSLGCGTVAQASQVVGPSLTADVENGEVLEPFQAAEAEGQPWVVAKVDSIQTPSFEELRPQLEQAVPDTGQAALQSAMGTILRRADVTVASKYGTWDAETGQVVPPVGATATTQPSADPTTGETVPGDAG